MLAAKFKTNDHAWSSQVLMKNVEQTWRTKLKPIRGDLRIRIQGEDPGVFKERSSQIEKASKLVTTAREPGLQVLLENEQHKGVAARVVSIVNPFGQVYPCVGPCRDDYPNMRYGHNGAGQLVKLQSPVLEAYAEAERINGRPIRITGEGFRSCAQQTQLYRSDPNRFANPDNSRHCRGLALDIYNTADNLTAKAKQSLIEVGFRFGVSGEPWHCSYLDGN